jgi:hypothetical protein
MDSESDELYDFKEKLFKFLKNNNMNTKYTEDIIYYLLEINNITIDNHKDKITLFVKKMEDNEKNWEKECQSNGHLITSFWYGEVDCLQCNKKWKCKSCSYRTKEDEHCRNNHFNYWKANECGDDKKNCIECDNLIKYKSCCKN